MWWTDCLKVWMLETLDVWKFECLKVWMSASLDVWKFECLKVWMSESLDAWKFECLRVWMSESLNVWKFECPKVWMSESLNIWKSGLKSFWFHMISCSVLMLTCTPYYPGKGHLKRWAPRLSNTFLSQEGMKQHNIYGRARNKLLAAFYCHKWWENDSQHSLLWPGTWTHPQSSDSCFFGGWQIVFLASYAFNLPVLHEDLAVAVKKFLELYRNGQWPGCPASFLNLAALEIQSGSWRSPNVGRIHMVFHGMPASFQSKNWRM